MSPPTYDAWNRMFQVFAVSEFLLLCKYFVTLIIAINPEDHPDEDKQIFARMHKPANIHLRQSLASDEVAHVPTHLVIFLAAFVVQNFCNASGNGATETVVLTCLIVAYAFFRCLFTFLSYFLLHTYQNIAFVCSNIVLFAAAVLMLETSFQINPVVLFHK